MHHGVFAGEVGDLADVVPRHTLVSVGFVVVRRRMEDRACIVVTVAEHRSSDQIVIMSWEYEDKYFLNPPTVDDVPGHAWAGMQLVNYGRVDLAVALIEKIVGRFLKSRAEVMKGKPEAQPAVQLVLITPDAS